MADATLKIESEVERFLREAMAERLSRITPEQRELFDRIFPNGVKRADLERAIDLCDRTLRKNDAGRVATAPATATADGGAGREVGK